MKISYEITNKRAINWRFIDSEGRKQILSDGRQSAIQQRQEGTDLYQKIILSINSDAKNLLDNLTIEIIDACPPLGQVPQTGWLDGVKALLAENFRLNYVGKF